MTRTTSMEQRGHMMPLVAPAGPAMLDPMGGKRAGSGIAGPWACVTTATRGFTANATTRHLGRSST